MSLFTAETLVELTGIPFKDEQRGLIFAGLPELAYSRATPAQEASIFADIEETIATKSFRVVGDGDDNAVWSRGWGEVSAKVAAAEQVTIETLKPQYYHNEVPLRMLGGYVYPHTDYFEYYVGIAVRRQVLLTYLDNPRRLVELGCGTGMNLLLASQLFPEAALAGSDWVQPTLDILATMGKSIGRPIDGTLYDMLTGKGFEDVRIDHETDVLTFHALEQIGDSAGPVLDGLIKRRPRRCMHMEPILDFYNRSVPFDDIGARYHQSRRYLTGLYPLLKEREVAGDIKIIAERRIPLGNLYHEAYSYVIWSPL